MAKDDLFPDGFPNGDAGRPADRRFDTRVGYGDESEPGSASSAMAALPPELDPRGRRAARRRAEAAAAGAPVADSPASGRRSSAAPAGRRVMVGNRHSAMTGAGLGVRIVAAALSLLVLVGSGYAWASYRTFTQDIVRVQLPPALPGAKNVDGADQNILIIGNDDRSTASPAELALLGTTTDGGSTNTDTMMLLHVPANGRKATLVSFPRDSYVAIPRHGMAKLNSAYPDGISDGNGSKAAGVALLVQTIEGLTGLSIDHFAQIDLLGFYRISNAIGPVTVCLNNAMGPAQDSGYEPDGKFVASYSGINLKKGNNSIVGSQALAFVRQRHGLPNGDLDRIKRQQYFLAAVFRKLTSSGTLLNPLTLQSLLKAVSKSLTLDEHLEPLQLTQQMSDLSAGNVTFATIPTNGTTDVAGVGNVVVVDHDKLPDFIGALYGATSSSALQTAKPVPAGSFTVNVENASGVALRATKNAALLTKLGFKTAIPNVDPAPLAATTIRYPTGLEGAAKTLAARVPGATLIRSSDVTVVTLILGSNNVQATTPAGVAPKSLRTLSGPRVILAKATAPASATAGAAATAPAAAAPAGATTAATGGCIN